MTRDRRTSLDRLMTRGLRTSLDRLMTLDPPTSPDPRMSLDLPMSPDPLTNRDLMSLGRRTSLSPRNPSARSHSIRSARNHSTRSSPSGPSHFHSVRVSAQVWAQVSVPVSDQA
jgi:hypothetical protein